MYKNLIFFYGEDFTQTDPFLILHVSAGVHRCISVGDPVYDKLMEMDVGPAHHDLQNFVEAVETDLARDLNPSPNGRSDPFESDLDLINEIRSPALPRLFLLFSACFPSTSDSVYPSSPGQP